MLMDKWTWDAKYTLVFRWLYTYNKLIPAPIHIGPITENLWERYSCVCSLLLSDNVSK